MTRFFPFLFVIIVSIVPTPARGQTTPSRTADVLDSSSRLSRDASRYPIVVSMGSQSLTVPWHLGPVNNRWNPAFVVGSERTLRPAGWARLFGTLNVGYFQNYWWMTGLFVDSELGAERSLPLGFRADLRLGLGYLHYFWRRRVLELKNGRYVSAKDWGEPSLLVPVALVLGYQGDPARPLIAEPFVSVQWAVQTPFIEESPVMTHFFLAVGARINWDRPTPTAER